MLFHPIRRRSTSGPPLRPVEQPANPSPRPAAAGEPGRSELADEAEAFVHGNLAEIRAANGGSLAAWMVVNRICHGDAVELYDLAAGAVSRTPLAGVSPSYHQIWNTAQRAMATRLLERAHDAEAIRQVQHDVLIPLELRLIALSHDEPLTFARVVADTVDAIEHAPLDR